MSKATLPDKTKALVDQQGIPSIAYMLFFDALARGDTGTDFTPVFTNLASVGTPTITGRYFYIGSFVYFKIEITPSTSTSSTLGTTYANFPLQLQSDGVCFAINGYNAGAGTCTVANNRIYTPTWSGITSKVTITGFVEAK